MTKPNQRHRFAYPPVRPTMPLQPRRLIMAPAAVACKRMVSRLRQSSISEIRSFIARLFRVSTTDGVTLAVALAIVVGVGTAASALPIIRASRVELFAILASRIGFECEAHAERLIDLAVIGRGDWGSARKVRGHQHLVRREDRNRG